MLLELIEYCCFAGESPESTVRLYTVVSKQKRAAKCVELCELVTGDVF